MVNTEIEIRTASFETDFSSKKELLGTRFNPIHPPGVLHGDHANNNPLLQVEMIAQSSGSTFFANNIFDLRLVTVPPNIVPSTPLFIPNFYTLVGTDGVIALNVLRQYDTNGQVVYGVVYSYVAGGPTGSFDLTVVTLKDPPGSFPTFPSTPNAPITSQVVKRQVNGDEFVYDYFMVSPS